MELQSLTLHNFRQFADEVIEFSRDRKNNVTVIHGPNGSGKTTLLNAFTWVMYDSVDFDTRPERLASEGAMAAAEPGDTIEVEVLLEFEHEGQEYRAMRWADFRKRGSEALGDEMDFDGERIDEGLVVEYTDKDGRTQTRDDPKTALYQILPKRLRELFFFDGEDIDELGGIDNQGRIQEAIQNIMGLTILERSIRHLGSVEEWFEKQMEKHASEELSTLTSERRETNEARRGAEQKLNDERNAVEELNREIKDIGQELSAIDDSAALERERQKNRERREKLKDDIGALDEQIRKQISTSGYLTFAMPAIEKTAQDLDELREQGHIPSELNADFVDTLLDRGTCICGRPIEQHTKAFENVAQHRSEMSANGIDQAAIRIIAHLDLITDKRSSFFEDVEQIFGERREKQDEIERCNGQIEDISAELAEMDTSSGKDHATPAELEETRERKEKKRDELIGSSALLTERIEDLEGEIDELDAEIDKAREEETKALTARRRRKAAQLARKQLKEAFADLQQNVRRRSNTLITETFNRIASKELTAEITEEFELRIWQNVGSERVEVEKSTGERQIASLAFIGSLVSIAKRQYNSENDSPYFTGGIYPIVMDSPFGALDKEHRRQVGRAMPELAGQVVVLVTDSQWEGPVAEEMEEVAEKQYYLNFNDGKDSNSDPRTRVESEHRGSAASGD